MTSPVLTQALEALELAVLQNGCDMLLTGEELRILESAIASLRAADAGVPTWQPIETAPAGGGDILLWWKGRGMGRGRYMANETGEGWMLDGDRCVPAKKCQRDCTHWMPLLPDPDSALSALPAAPAPQQETFWLIERGPNQGSPQHLWLNNSRDGKVYGWKTSVHQATKFTSEEEAQRVRRASVALMDDAWCCVTSHSMLGEA